MTLKEFRRLVDRIDHKHDDKLIKLASDRGDYDPDGDTPIVSDAARVFIFLREEE